MASSRLRVSESLADRICRALLPLADNALVLSNRLVDGGFTAHVAWARFFESFASTEEELTEYRTYRIEVAKEYIGTPWPLSAFQPSAKFFRSERLLQLMAKRDDANGVPANRLSETFSVGEALWRRELTSCDRRRVQLEQNARAQYETLSAQADLASQAALKQESESTNTSLSRLYAAGMNEDRISLYADAVEQYGARLGFSRDPAKSGRRLPIFSKQIAGEWDLCWVHEDIEMMVGAPNQGLCAPALQLRGRALRGSVSRASVDAYLHLRIQMVPPEFARAYHSFEDLPTIETIVRAYMYLYEITGPVIEGAIKRALLN